MKNQIKIALVCMEENDLGVTMDLICNYFATVNLMVNHVELGMNVKTTFAKMASALVGLWNGLKNLPCLQNEII